MPDIQKNEAKFIRRALEAEFTAQSICNYYANAKANAASQAVLDAIQLRMRKDFAHAAHKSFGAKGDYASQVLAQVREDVAAQFDLSGNRLGLHIKVGGHESRTGEAYLYRYVSYRARGEQYGAQLALIQQASDTELRVMVRHYRADAGDDNVEIVRWFPIGDMATAQQCYVDLLDQLAVPRLPDCSQPSYAGPGPHRGRQ